MLITNPRTEVGQISSRIGSVAENRNSTSTATIKLIRQLHEDWQDQVKIINSIRPTGRTVITITAHDADKGFALKAACNHLSIAIDSIVAFRDADNDILMFQRAGLSIAMGQADHNVKAPASHVMGDRREDGGRYAGLLFS